MEEKPLPFIVAALVFGLGLGYGGAVMFDATTSTAPAPMANTKEVKEVSAKESEALVAKLRHAESELEKLRETPLANAATLAVENRKLLAKVADLIHENETLKTMRADTPAKELTLDELKLVAFDKLTPAQRALLKAEAKKLLISFQAAVAKGDKGEILGQIYGIRDLGLAAKDEFLEAYDVFASIGNPWAGEAGNKLGLKMQEFNSVMHPDVADYIANMKGDDIPIGAQIHAANVIAWDEKRSLAHRAHSFGNLLRNAKSEWAVQSAAQSLTYLEGEEIGAMLIEVVMDASVKASTRAQCAVLIGNSYSTQITPEQIAILQADQDSELVEAALYIANVKNPPVSGYAIAACDPGSQARVAGMQTGDVITTYDGVTIDSQAKLTEMQEKSLAYQVEVVVLRRGENVILKVSGGKLGIHGQFITKP